MTSIKTTTGTIDEKSVITKPSDREFRDAWKLDGGVITIDVAAAKAIAKERVEREMIAAEHQKLIKASIKGALDTKKAAIDAATTVEEIKAAME